MKKIEVTQQQRDNLLEALNVMWPSVPEANVSKNLRDWAGGFGGVKPTCGTVACFGGWTEMWPSFKKQLVNVSTPSYGLDWEDVLNLYGGIEWGEVGDNGTDMFVPRGSHLADKTFDGSDHELVTNRMKWMLANSRVVKD